MIVRPTLNVPLLRKTLEHIEAHPEEWNQRTWSCGTAGCFAWHAVMLAGAKPLKVDPSYVQAEGDDPPDEIYPADDDYPVDHIHVVARARKVLGYEVAERDLFAASNTLDDLRRIVGHLVATEESA